MAVKARSVARRQDVNALPLGRAVVPCRAYRNRLCGR
jgi:hypothetical protein